MASHFLLYQRPLVMDETQAALRVEGALPYYAPGTEYVGELDIVNSVGRVTLEVLESTLPPGATVRVDNVRKKVVVKWPAYIVVPPLENGVPNGGFESGDDGTWAMGWSGERTGWEIGQYGSFNTYSGTHSARFWHHKSKGSDMVIRDIPAKLNDYITLSAKIQQGASSAGNAGAKVSLIFRDINRAQIARFDGNMVSSGSNGAWKDSTVQGAGPAGTAAVDIIVSAYRNRQDKPLFVDEVKWDHSYTLGTTAMDDFYLAIKVTDGLNRDAYWDGYVSVDSLYFTSKLYPAFIEDRATILSTEVTGVSIADTVREAIARDAASVSYSITGIELASSEPPKVAESASVTYAITGVSVADIPVLAVKDSASVSYAVSLVDLSTTPRGTAVEAATMSYEITGVTLT